MVAEQKPEVVRAGPARVWLDPDSRIIMIDFDENAELDIEQAKLGTAANVKVTGGEARPMLVDFTNMKSQSKECREYYAKDPGHIKTYSAVAIVVGNPLSRVIANFFLGLNKPLKPTKLFDDKQKAIEWLKQF